MADGNLLTFPARLRVVGHPQAPAGTYGYPEPAPIPEPMPRVNVTGCADGYRVWLFGKPYRDFSSLTNASRVASALMTLDALDCLPGGETIPDPEAA